MRVKAYIDVFQNEGYLKIFIFGIRFIKLDVRVRQIDRIHNNLVIGTKTKKREYHINADANDENSIAKWFKGFVPYFNIISIAVSARIGKRDDALFTAFLLHGTRLLIHGLLSFLKSREHIAVSSRFKPEFNRDMIKLKIDGIIDVTVADIIYSFAAHTAKRQLKAAA